MNTIEKTKNDKTDPDKDPNFTKLVSALILIVILIWLLF